ncbi:tRNA lysidine(34) synthetase TilS [Candidatus Halobeggiatoa sp. HSG11]|nr:tRNA lysidine(34) synthetase TilS [Candidatus Halobeggiatoa sp. HSG11]
MTNLNSHLATIIRSCPADKTFWIAYSGGMDSHVLLHAMTQLRESIKFKLHAIHINHNLNSQANDWAKHCQNICAKLSVTCEIIQVKVQPKSRESLEACARKVRYEAIAKLLLKDDIVLVAQHADDQTETVLLQLLRGSGVAGLAAMPEKSRLGAGWLVRPLLNYSRSQLFEYAQHLQWVEDDSNSDTRFDRNFLRHEIIPLLTQRWPNINKTLGRVASHSAEANELIQLLAEQDLQTCVGQHSEQLFLPTVNKLAPIRQRNLLRFWLKQLNLPMPSAAHLQHILSDVLMAKSDKQPLVSWKGGEVRRYKQHLFAMQNLPPLPTHDITWSFPNPIDLPLGKMTVTRVQNGGLHLPINTQLQICFRKGGEVFQWHKHKRSVKKLLQDAQIPPWQRPFIPLIYLDNTLITIPNIGVADKCKSQENGWQINYGV